MQDQKADSPKSKTQSKLFSVLVLLHALLFLGFWLTNTLFYTATNDYLAGLLGSPLDYIRLFLAWAGLMGVWSAMRLVAPRFRGLSWLFAFLGILFLVFFYGSFWMLFRESPVQTLRLQHLVGYYRGWLDILALAGLAFLLAAWLRRAGCSRVRLGAVLVVYLLAWLMPLFLPPGNVYSSSLPAKPRIIAHRGASMLAPENTLVAMQLAVQLGAYGLESDLRLSADGTLFLMHDDTLKRTTNVAERFSGREEQRSESFQWSEVRQLNAGEWFVAQDPFGAIAHQRVTPDQIATFHSQGIPTLAEMLEVVRQSGAVFIFDLKQPPAGNAYGEQFFELAFEQIRSAAMDPQIWFLVNPEQAQTVRTQAPAMKRVSGIDYLQPPDPSDLQGDSYQIVNAEYGLSRAWIRNYQAAGLWVNLYTVDESWQFSRLWLLGVDSITTSNAGAMLALAQPLLALSYTRYVILWGLLGFGGMVLIRRYSKG